MKKTIFVFCMLMLTFVNTKAQQQSSAPEKKNAVLVSGGALVISQNRYAERLTEFRPAADVLYHRMLGNNWGIGLGYGYSEFDPICCFVKLNSRTYSTKFDCVQQNNICQIAPDFSLCLNGFNLTPYLAMGICWTKLTFDHNDNRTDWQTCFVLSPGIRMGYNTRCWAFFASWHFDYCFSSMYNYPYITTMDGTIEYTRGHHSLNLGVGYTF